MQEPVPLIDPPLDDEDPELEELAEQAVVDALRGFIPGVALAAVPTVVRRFRLMRLDDVKTLASVVYTASPIRAASLGWLLIDEDRKRRGIVIEEKPEGEDVDECPPS